VDEDDRHDLELHRLVSARERSAFDELYRRYARSAYGVALRVTSQDLIAQEVVQDAFLRTLYPPFERSAPEEMGYQKCEPVSGSEYESVPIFPEFSGRMYRSISSGVARSMIALTAPMCIT